MMALSDDYIICIRKFYWKFNAVSNSKLAANLGHMSRERRSMSIEKTKVTWFSESEDD